MVIAESGQGVLNSWIGLSEGGGTGSTCKRLLPHLCPVDELAIDGIPLHLIKRGGKIRMSPGQGGRRRRCHRLTTTGERQSQHEHGDEQTKVAHSSVSLLVWQVCQAVHWDRGPISNNPMAARLRDTYCCGSVPYLFSLSKIFRREEGAQKKELFAQSLWMPL